MSNQDPISGRTQPTQNPFDFTRNSNIISLFGSTDEEDEVEEVPCSPFVLTGLPPEPQEGNIEYKWKLVAPDSNRLQHLSTQMNWRLEEGQGEALYRIGVEDDGTLTGVSREELQESIDTLYKMAQPIGASITELQKRKVGEGKFIMEVLVRKVPNDQQFIDLRVCVLGTVASGKSSLVSVCTHDELDNGRGAARLDLFRHQHEIKSGRTSSITHEILGFNDKGESIDYGTYKTANEICQRSTKIITFTDLAGHSRYMRTTIFGLSAHAADFAMLCIDAPSGVVETTKEHLSCAIALNVPVVVVVTKIDLCTKADVQKIVDSLTELLTHQNGSKPIQAVFVDKQDDLLPLANMLVARSICPIFAVSSVTGANIDLLKKFLNILPPRLTPNEQERLSQLPVEFRIHEIYVSNNDGATVAAGTLRGGIIRTGQDFLIGPLPDGTFFPCQVSTIERYRVPRQRVRAGQAATLNLPKIEESRLRKGMVLVSPDSNPKACTEFVARIYLSMHHTTTPIRKGFEMTVHIVNICQTVLIVDMDKEDLYPDQEATVTFRFRNRCEYVVEGSRLIFRHGNQTKGSGQVMKVLHQQESTTNST